MGRTCSTNGDKRNPYRNLAGEPKGKRPLGKSRCRLADNIEMDFREVECSGMNRIDLAEDGDQWRALVNTVMNLRVP
jgi:hypothetical protein